MSGPASLWWVDDAGSLHLGFHEYQCRLWDSKARFPIATAGTQGGKTSFGPWWLRREIERQGEGDYLAVTATYDLFKLKMLPEMLTVFCDLLGEGTYYASDRVIALKQPEGRIILRSANAPGGLESATANAAWLDELGQDEFTRDAWEATLRRLSLRQGRCLGTTTVYNLGWLYEEYRKWQTGDNPEFEFIQFPSIANPAFPMEEFERRRRDLPAWKFAMFYEGRFERPAGMIYGDFDESVHWTPAFAIPEDWSRYVGLDPGGSNTAVLWLARSPEGMSYVYRELLTGDLSTKDLVAKVRAYDEPVTGWYGGAKSEKQVRLDWRSAGVPMREPPVVDVEQGIDRVIEGFRRNRLYVMDSCPHLKDQIMTYARELDDAGQPTDRIKDKERYHLCDALRYVVAGMTRPAYRDISIGKPAFQGGR